jgi:chromosome segregation ATPase
MAAMTQREVEERLALEQLQKSLEQKLQELRVELLSLQSESLALNLMSEGTYSNELDMIEEELSRSLSQRVVVSESRKARKEINKRKNTLDKIRSDAAKLKRLISRIESEFEEIEWPMPKHEFQAVTEKLLKVAASVAPALAEFVTHRHEDFDKYRKLEMQTDLTRPHEWYPRARLDKRRIIFHAGPTNSGKTYNALQRLKQANKGMYLAPLRLLAAEIYENLNAEGIYIDLLTGECCICTIFQKLARVGIAQSFCSTCYQVKNVERCHLRPIDHRL